MENDKKKHDYVHVLLDGLPILLHTFLQFSLRNAPTITKVVDELASRLLMERKSLSPTHELGSR